jgi:hypothetical protein
MSSDALNATWYYPKMTRLDAEKCLESAAPGAFVVRPSSQADCLALSHRNHDGAGIGHALIYSGSHGFMLERTNRYLPTVLAVLQTLPLNFDAVVATPLQSAADINRAESSSSSLPPDVEHLLLTVQPHATTPRRSDPAPWDDPDDADLHDSDDAEPPDAADADADVADVTLDDVDVLVASPPRPLRSALRDALYQRKREQGGSIALSSTMDKETATATLRSSRASQAPIDEAYLLRLLAFPDLLNPALMTSEENRLFERLVVQLQLQLQS